MSLKSPLQSFQKHLGEEFSQLILESIHRHYNLTLSQPLDSFSELMAGTRLSNSPLGWLDMREMMGPLDIQVSTFRQNSLPLPLRGRAGL